MSLRAAVPLVAILWLIGFLAVAEAYRQSQPERSAYAEL